MEIKRNEETGILQIWEGGKPIGEIITMGDVEGEEDDEAGG